MKTKVSQYKNVVNYIRRVCKHPSPAMLDVYEQGAKRALVDNDFVMSMHLAVSLSERYREVNVPVWLSRELEMLVWDLHVKGYSTQEMFVVCQVASHNKWHTAMASAAFTYISKTVMDHAMELGDVVFQVKEDVFMLQKDHKHKAPNLIDKEFSNN